MLLRVPMVAPDFLSHKRGGVTSMASISPTNSLITWRLLRPMREQAGWRFQPMREQGAKGQMKSTKTTKQNTKEEIDHKLTNKR